MKSTSVIIDRHTKYSIDLKDEYNFEEFISFFEGQILKVKKILSITSDLAVLNTKKEGNEIFQKNQIFSKLDALIENLGNDIAKKDNATMRTYTSMVRSTDKRRGLVWLKPVGNSLVIHLRPGDHSKVDKQGKIAYTKPGKKTFGNYPTMKVNDLSEVEYAFKIIKSIYDLS